MRKCIPSLLSLLLTAALLLACVPTVVADEFTLHTQLMGNTGAVLTANTAVSAHTTNTDLVDVTVNGTTVTVTAREKAVGVAAVTVTGGSVTQTVEIPVGYTTFLFDRDTLTVFDGHDEQYAITGLYPGATEAIPTPVEDSDDKTVYQNTASHRLNVAIQQTGGTYVFAGEGADMSITVAKGATAPATLLLAGLTLSSSFTAPITVKKDSVSTVSITALAGHSNTLTDASWNNADLYGDTTDGGDGTNADYAESAVIKGKASAKITLEGQGTLNLICHTKTP